MVSTDPWLEFQATGWPSEAPDWSFKVPDGLQRPLAVILGYQIDFRGPWIKFLEARLSFKLLEGLQRPLVGILGPWLKF